MITVASIVNGCGCGGVALLTVLSCAPLPPAGPAVHKHQYSSGHAVTDINLDNVCKKGNTLLWDLVQDEDAVRQKHPALYFRPTLNPLLSCYL